MKIFLILIALLIFNARTIGQPKVILIKDVTNEDFASYLIKSPIDHSIYAYFKKSGIKIYKNNIWTNLNDQFKVVKDIEISCFYIDKKGRLWLGSQGSGLYLLTDANVKKYPDSLSKNISQIIEDKYGNIFIATMDNGLVKIDTNNIITVSKAELPRQRELLSIVIDSAEIIWAGTWRSGIMNYKRGIWTEFPTNNWNEIYVPCIGIDTQDKKWFLYWRNEGVKTFDNEKWVSYKLPNEDNNYATCYLHNKKNDTWIGTAQGILVFRNNKLEKLITNSNLDYSYIYSMLEDDNKHIWVATSKGLFRIEAVSKSLIN
ncbi:MAG TPA: two-component regulator propeller domain-containing protein [Chitinophagaceae bacterium]|nr:two-component regulator propeller domain-containing protein [Chitinophagaceae bacterium]